jgi:hypothetical protein
VIKPRRTRWTRHVAYMRELRSAYTFLLENSKGRYHLRGLGVEERIILKLILKKQDVRV